jgi:hypothetical protein
MAFLTISFWHVLDATFSLQLNISSQNHWYTFHFFLHKHLLAKVLCFACRPTELLEGILKSDVKVTSGKSKAPERIPYPGSMIGTQKNVIRHMLILGNILQYIFFFSVKKNWKKIIFLIFRHSIFEIILCRTHYQATILNLCRFMCCGVQYSTYIGSIQERYTNH